MINVLYTSAWPNPSGYGSAARNFITSLFVAGVNISCETVSQMSERTDYGVTGKICQGLENRTIPYKIKIVHLTPDLYPIYNEKGVYTIGHLFWETDKLPASWITPCNNVDELWVASAQMAAMIKDSGVTTPCYAFPQPINVAHAEEIIRPFQTPYPKVFTFYSIFQWIDRKNARGLLRAYWKAFEGNDSVQLRIKTYRIMYTKQELDIIRNDIARWKKELGQEHYPKVSIVHKLLTDSQMARFHMMGDAFVNPSSGEGWNRPMQEAMLYGKPTISGDNGGITDIMNDYIKVQSSLVPASQQPFIAWYTADMKWRELNENHLISQLKDTREQYAKAKIIAKNAQDYVINEFNFQKVGFLMKTRLEEICQTL